MVGGVPLILLLYVDDLFITGGEHLIEACKKNLTSEFKMTNLGLMHYYLGMEVWQEDGHVFLGQGKYVANVMRRFQMEDCRPMSTPMITNWKKLHASKGELVDPTFISSAYWFVDVFGQHQTKYKFCSEHSQSVHGGAQESALDNRKTYFEIPCWDYRLWSRLQKVKWSGLGWLHRFKLRK